MSDTPTAENDALVNALRALAAEWDANSDRLYSEARGADRDQAIVLRSKSGTYAVNAERLAAVLDEHTRPIPPAATECPSRCGRNDPCPDSWHDRRCPIPPANTEEAPDARA